MIMASAPRVFCLRIIRINWIGIRAQVFKDNYYNWDNFL